MPRTAAIIALRELDTGQLMFVDANGNEHVASNGPAAWILLKQILADPTLPEVEQHATADGEIQLEMVITNFVESQMPHGLAPLARPAVSGVFQALQKHLSRRTG
jgi:hypothetical protein